MTYETESLAMWIERTLAERLEPEALTVTDESHRHEGHANYRAGEQTHFHIAVTTKAFAGKSRIERHRMVNEILAPAFAKGAHAVRIDARAPGE